VPYSFTAVNVDAQERTTTSLLRWMRRTIQVRGKTRAFGRGTFEPLHPANRRVLVFLRRYEDDVILCVNNLSRFVQPVELDLSAFNGWTPVELYSDQPFPKIGELPYFFTLGPHNFFWFRLTPPAGGAPVAGDAVASATSAAAAANPARLTDTPSVPEGSGS
jgi:maltose alpha-D-glucosyltransferase/alpha-amylase